MIPINGAHKKSSIVAIDSQSHDPDERVDHSYNRLFAKGACMTDAFQLVGNGGSEECRYRWRTALLTQAIVLPPGKCERSLKCVEQ
jgi:hypothetical protein